MKNIHVISTSQPSRLLRGLEGIRLFKNEVSPDNQWCVNVNISITSDEEIKEGEPRINNYQRKLKGEEIPSKKIILTTDQDLIKEGVQDIPDEFLDWFIKNPSCEMVEVNWTIPAYNVKKEYRVVIPKEEPKQAKIMERFIANAKQETLEEFCIEFVKKHFEDERTYNPSSIITAMKVSAKWQQEQIGKSEFLQRLRGTLSDAEARRLIFETFKKK